MANRQELELTWIGTDNRPKQGPRILAEDRERSCHAKHRVTETDSSDNGPIFVDSLAVERPVVRFQ